MIAIGSVVGAAGGGLRGTMPDEVTATVQLYLAGKIDQWFVRKDKPGVVFVINAAGAEDARALLDGLPLARAGIMKFELIPVGPLAPLAVLTRAAR